MPLSKIILLLIIYNFEWVFEKLYFYQKNYAGINKANSAIFIWSINFFPMALYITNISKFNFSKIFKNQNCQFFAVDKNLTKRDKKYLQKFQNVVICDESKVTSE